MKYFFYLLYFLYIYINCSNLIKFSFKRVFYKKLSKENLIDLLPINRIDIDLKIGSNKQIVPMSIKINKHISSIVGTTTKNLFSNNIKKYDEKKSNTYKCIDNNLDYSTIFIGYKSCDNIYINNKLFPFNFILTEEKEDNDVIKESGILGLGMELISYNNEENSLNNNNNNNNEIKSFINQLLDNNIINKPIFSLKYISKNEGELIIGDFPNQNKNDSLKMTIDVSKSNGDDKWNIKMDNLFYGKNILFDNIGTFIVDFEIETGVIVTGNLFKVYIKEKFFNKYIKKNICKEMTINFDIYTYYYFECNDNVNIKEHNELIFNSKELGFNFNLNSNDLFYEFKGKYYYLIFFISEYSSNWLFGMPFFNKYQTVFDLTPKEEKIGFYTNINNFNNNKVLPLYIKILLFFCLIIIVFLFYIIYYKLKGQRKIRANELEENIFYKLNNNNNI